eukprot:TRINITY_DN3146_c0_g2_i1.p1 TRINITY_DN3146_c0_g2~~TRINITY_DN3146_c0_g2_i1.p1  ORF type:complete len:549 (-),score=224.79 TRINITY_DN3146_c0_g2_i1:113-1759(-)
MGRKKPFINKKNADTFQLINRNTSSPQDPNAPPVFLQHGIPKNIAKVNEDGEFEDDEEEEMFQPNQGKNERGNHNNSKRNGKEEDFSDEELDEDEEEMLAAMGGYKPTKKTTKYRDDDYEFGEYGFPDDGYDYTKHFKPTGGGGVYIPSTVFDKPDLVSKAQKDSERLLERIDPEILAALNDELDDAEGELPEDFLEMAGGVEGDPEEREDHVFGSFRSKRKREQMMASMYLDYEDGEEDDDEYDEDDEDNEFERRGGKRVPQNFMEEKFEVIQKQYDDDELGELDEDDPSVRGTADISDFADILSQHLGEMNVGKKAPQSRPASKQTRHSRHPDDDDDEDDDELGSEDEFDEGEDGNESGSEHGSNQDKKKKSIYAADEEEDPEIQKAWKERVLKMAEEENAKSDAEDDEDDEKIFESWYTESKRIDDDCESVLSTYTNTENHPKLLEEPKASKKIRISAKTGMPIGVLPTRKKAVPEPPVEPKKENLGKARTKETLEEKKARKKAIKAERKENRERKKQLKSKFQKEELRQKGLMTSNRVQPAVVF